jgi:hypothetical protein
MKIFKEQGTESTVYNWRIGYKNNTGNFILHNEDGPSIFYKNKFIEYYSHGLRHREVGPASFNQYMKYWFFKGRLHRKDGPAIERVNGENEWHFQGKKIFVSSQPEFDKAIKYINF